MACKAAGKDQQASLALDEASKASDISTLTMRILNRHKDMSSHMSDWFMYSCKQCM